MEELHNLIEKAAKTQEKLEAVCNSVKETCEDINMTFYKEPVVRIYNPVQSAKYMKHGVRPLDFYVDPTEDKIVFVFSKEQTKELYTLWLKHEI